MNQLENHIRQIMETAMIKIVQAVQAAPSAEIGAAFGNSARTNAPSTHAAPASPRPGPKQAIVRAPNNNAPSRTELTQQILSAIKQSRNPVSSGELAQQLGQRGEHLAPSLRVLRAAGQIQMLGDKRSARYVVTSQAQRPQPAPQKQTPQWASDMVYTPEQVEEEPEQEQMDSTVVPQNIKANRYARTKDGGAE